MFLNVLKCNYKVAITYITFTDSYVGQFIDYLRPHTESPPLWSITFYNKVEVDLLLRHSYNGLH